jgi:hypothetical protein
LPRLFLHKTGRTFTLGSNPAWDILGRSMPVVKSLRHHAVGQIGVVEEKR